MSPYKEATWITIGREAGSMRMWRQIVFSTARVSAFRVMTAFFRIRGQASKGITNTADNTMGCVVTRGKVMVVLNSLQFMATRGDTIYIPPHSIYDLVNMWRVQA